MAVRADLVQVYSDYYEEEIERAYDGKGLTHDWRKFKEEWALARIASHSKLERLDIYCEWEGILGYAGVLYDIATTGGER